MSQQSPTQRDALRPVASDGGRERPAASSPLDRLRTDAGGSPWPERAADTVDSIVSGVHDKAIRPLVLVVRIAVYGLLIATMLAALVLLGSIAVLRLLDSYLFTDQVWASYVLLGGLLTLGGLVAWSRRNPRTEKP